MFTKIRSITLALTAIAALGTATLVTSTTSADARGGMGFHGGMGGHGGMRMGGTRMMGGVHHVGGVRIGARFVGGHHFAGRIPHFRPNWCRFHGRCGIHVRWHHPWIYGTPVVAATTYAAVPTTVAAAPRCNCLTKEYTQDGLVVFHDVCTKEVASAPIGNTQAQLPLPQDQQQTQPQAQ